MKGRILRLNAPKRMLTMLESMKPRQKGSSAVGLPPPSAETREVAPKARISSCHVCATGSRSMGLEGMAPLLVYTLDRIKP